MTPMKQKFSGKKKRKEMFVYPENSVIYHCCWRRNSQNPDFNIYETLSIALYALREQQFDSVMISLMMNVLLDVLENAWYHHLECIAQKQTVYVDH